jgi:hypothetical protein
MWSHQRQYGKIGTVLWEVGSKREGGEQDVSRLKWRREV